MLVAELRIPSLVVFAGFTGQNLLRIQARSGSALDMDHLHTNWPSVPSSPESAPFLENRVYSEPGTKIFKEFLRRPPLCADSYKRPGTGRERHCPTRLEVVK
jgi:hypothetical protein